MIEPWVAAVACGLAVFAGGWALLAPSAGRLALRRLRDRELTPDPVERMPAEASSELLRSDAVSGNPRLRALLARLRWTERRAGDLERAALPLSVSEYATLLLAIFLVGSVLVTVISGLLIAGFGSGVAALLAAEWLLVRRGRQRTERFAQQLPAALQSMSTSLKSGFSILEAIRAAVRETEAPISVELARILDEQRVGGALDESLSKLAERLDVPDFHIVARALNTHRRVGGNLAEILERVASTMREREKLRGQVRALTAEQRFSSLIVGMLPLWVLAFFGLTDPDFISPLWEEPLGRVFLAAGGTMEVLAFLLLRRMARVDV